MLAIRTPAGTTALSDSGPSVVSRLSLGAIGSDFWGLGVGGALDRPLLKATGVNYFLIETATDSATKKMVHMK
jgi:hypothetical protein